MAAFANKCLKNVRKQSLQKMRNVNLSRSNRRLQQPKALSSLIGFILVICKFDITSAMIYEKQYDGIQETRLSKNSQVYFQYILNLTIRISKMVRSMLGFPHENSKFCQDSFFTSRVCDIRKGIYWTKEDGDGNILCRQFRVSKTP